MSPSILASATPSIASFYKAKNEEERLYYEKLAQNWKLMIEKVQREERTQKAKLNEELAKKIKNK